MNHLYRIVFIAIFSFFIAETALAQKNYFTEVSEQSIPFSTEKRDIIPSKYQVLKVDVPSLHSFLWNLPKESSIAPNRGNAPVMLLPMPDGSSARFHVWESSIQEPGLEEKFPEIKTFAGQGIDDPYATIRFDYSPYFGFRAQILSAVTGRIYIDHFRRNDPEYCISYYHSDNHRVTNFRCLTEDAEYTARFSDLSRPGSTLAGQCRGTTLSTYRLAVACTGEYAMAVGAGLAGPTHASIVTTTNRVDGVYEIELSIRMVLIANNNLIEYLNGNTDPFVNVINVTLLNTNQTNTDLVIGFSNYDIGHVFTSDDNGLANLGVVCTSSKARGGTGSPSLVGDGFDIDYVAHEMGHQFGALHSFNSNTCASSGGSIEPGGGTTVMAYAGICAPTENIQPHSDAIFHALSYDQIINFITSSSGAGCASNSATNNTLPTVTILTPNNLTIPINTPFTLKASGSDADGDAITYNWEGWDVGPAGSWTSAANSTTRPLFRTRIPKTTGERTFPDPRVIAANYPLTSAPSVMDGLRGEVLPNVARVMKFRVTVKDNHAGGGGVVSAGSGCQDQAIFQVNTSGSTPFKVVVPNGGENYEGGSVQTVTWNVANTTASPFNTPNVKISISTDGGLTFPTVLVENTPNDGSESVIMPAVTTTTARIKVEAVENIFFDISNANFTLTAPTSGFTLSEPDPLNVTCGSLTPASITLETAQNGSFTTPINLSASNVPAGTTVSYSVNPVTPGNSTVVTLNNANTLAPGSYSILITGTAGAMVRTSTLTYVVSGGAAPVINTQPAPFSLCLGSSASFSVSATGATSYQWQVNTGSGFTNISGATSSTYNIPSPTESQDGNLYQVLAIGTCGTTTSSSALLTVKSPAQITSQPVDAASCIGASAQFSVGATGTNLTYQWMVSTTGCTGTFNNIGGANGSTYTVSNITAGMDGYAYRVRITGDCSAPLTSNCVLLSVGDPAAIMNNPANVTQCEGTTATFSPTVTGSVIGYQWEVNTGSGFTDIPGAVSGTLNLPNITLAMSGNQYRVRIFSCFANPLISNPATLTVSQQASFTNQPSNNTACVGGSTTFSQTAIGSGLSYQWQYASNCSGSFSNISGATGSTLSIGNVSLSDAGAYHLVVTGTCNTVTSNCVNLTVNTPLSITTQPQSTSVCLPTNTALFSVAATGTGLNYQWQVSTDGGSNYTNISGATSTTLTVNNITASYNNNKYRVVVNGNCSSATPSAAATLTVNSDVQITAEPVQSGSKCDQGTATLTVTATGVSLSYQWQMSTNGTTFTNITNSGVYSGATSNTLTITPLSTTLDGIFYRVIVNGVPCGSETSTALQLEVNTTPVVTLTSSSNQGITPSSRVTLTATVSPAGSYTFSWYKNGILDPTKTGDHIVADVDDLGSWEAEATSTISECMGRSAAINVTYASSNTMFIYPNPNRGQFVVRYFSDNSSTSRSLIVYDSKGSRVFSKMYTITSAYTGMQVDLRNASSGVYIVDLRDSFGNRIATGKVAVE